MLRLLRGSVTSCCDLPRSELPRISAHGPVPGVVRTGAMGLLPCTYRVRERRRAGATRSGGRLSRRQQVDPVGCLLTIILVVGGMFAIVAIVILFDTHPLPTTVVLLVGGVFVI